MTCSHRLGDLLCQRADPHPADADGGHVYVSTSVDDLHTVSEAAAEVRRG